VAGLKPSYLVLSRNVLYSHELHGHFKFYSEDSSTQACKSGKWKTTETTVGKLDNADCLKRCQIGGLWLNCG
jgi:hypothetical protein